MCITPVDIIAEVRLSQSKRAADRNRTYNAGTDERGSQTATLIMGAVREIAGRGVELARLKCVGFRHRTRAPALDTPTYDDLGRWYRKYDWNQRTEYRY